MGTGEPGQCGYWVTGKLFYPEPRPKEGTGDPASERVQILRAETAGWGEQRSRKKLPWG